MEDLHEDHSFLFGFCFLYLGEFLLEPGQQFYGLAFWKMLFAPAYISWHWVTLPLHLQYFAATWCIVLKETANSENH
ncbi:hypothetical protein [Pseudoflavonifractor sp. An44]|uniref:hypothetical protein n=1 Tax=Pseudoflavonifractor sp. An44 TaxID=1965635 RepID=UPI00117A3916|nr:hypothetical protein [Pseudoflavonifractor sp. An44]